MGKFFSSDRNRAIIGFILIGLGCGLIASSYLAPHASF